MTQYDGSTESNSTDTAQASDANTHSGSTESAEEHMQTIGRILYDIIQDWRRAQNDSAMKSSGSVKAHPLDLLKGRQI